jgi:hypothetical protein
MIFSYLFTSNCLCYISIKLIAIRKHTLKIEIIQNNVQNNQTQKFIKSNQQFIKSVDYIKIFKVLVSVLKDN